jgi:hypothetical protein
MSFMEQYFSELVIDHAHQVIAEDYDLSLERTHSFGPTHPRMVKKLLTQAALTDALELPTELKFIKELQKTLRELHQKDLFVTAYHSLSEVSGCLPESKQWPILSLIHIWDEKLVNTNGTYPQILDWPGYLTLVISENELATSPLSFGMSLLDESLSFFFSYDLWRPEGKVHQLQQNVKEALAELSHEKLEVSGLVFKIKSPKNDEFVTKLKNNGFTVSKKSDEIWMSIPLTWPTKVFEQWKKALEIN